MAKKKDSQKQPKLEKSIKEQKSTQSSGMLLFRAAQEWEHQFQNALRNDMLNSTQALVLQAVATLMQQGQPVTQILLSKSTGYTAMVISKNTRSLQERGFLQRNNHQNDGRAFSIALTDQGKAVHKRIEKTMNKLEAGLEEAGFSEKVRKALEMYTA